MASGGGAWTVAGTESVQPCGDQKVGKINRSVWRLKQQTYSENGKTLMYLTREFRIPIEARIGDVQRVIQVFANKYT